MLDTRSTKGWRVAVAIANASCGSIFAFAAHAALCRLAAEWAAHRVTGGIRSATAPRTGVKASYRWAQRPQPRLQQRPSSRRTPGYGSSKIDLAGHRVLLNGRTAFYGRFLQRATFNRVANSVFVYPFLPTKATIVVPAADTWICRAIPQMRPTQMKATTAMPSNRWPISEMQGESSCKCATTSSAVRIAGAAIRSVAVYSAWLVAAVTTSISSSVWCRCPLRTKP